MSKVPSTQHLRVRLPRGLTKAELEPVLCGYVRFLLRRGFPDHRVSVEVAPENPGHHLETWRQGETDEGEARQASPLEG